MNRKIVVIITFLIIIVACKSTRNVSDQTQQKPKIQSFGESPTLIRQPYLQMARSKSITITWKTNAITENCHVEFQQENQSKNTVVEGDLVDHEGFKFNEVVLTNLKPETTYTYAIYSNGHLLANGNEYYFKTAPKNKTVAFSFYAIGDIGAEPKISFAKEPAIQIKNLTIKPDFGLGLGDIVYPKGESNKYDSQFFKPFEEVFKNTPFYPVPGNHDWMSDPKKNFDKEWNLPNNEHYYSFVFSNALFIGMDSGNSGFFNKEEQIIWLKHTLIANKGKQDWIIVYLHHNGKSCTYKSDYEHVKALYETFANNNVDLVLNGHAHTYERLKPFDNEGNVDIDTTNQSEYSELKNRFISITIGAGGKINRFWKANPNDPKNCKDSNIVAHAEHVPSFGVFSINGKKLNFEAINSFTGKKFDNFSIHK